MKHKYLYIQAGNVLDESTTFYYVYIGGSSYDVRLMQRIKDYAQMNGHYFKKVDSLVNAFLLRVLDSVPGHRPIVQTNATQFVRSVMAGHALPYSPTQCHNSHRVNLSLKLDYRVIHHALRDNVINQKS